MLRFWLCWTLICVLSLLGSSGVLRAQTDAAAGAVTEQMPLVLPLVYRSAQQKVLLAMENPREADLSRKFLSDHKMQFDFVTKIDLAQVDYSAYHLIVIGSEGMRAFAEAKEPTAFEPLERFMAEGGHLLILGTFNGVNCEHLKRFGIATGFQHALGFRTIPGRSEVLFHGVEEIVPTNQLMRSTGNFIVERPHVAFLLRETTASAPDSPVLATLSHQKGRLTYTQVEPDYESASHWFLTTLLTWARNGAPTVAAQLDQVVELDARSLAEQRRLPVPSPTEMKAAEQAIQDKLADDFAAADTLGEKRDLAMRLVKLGPLEPDPVARFACLQLACGFFQETASPQGLFDTIQKLQAQYQVDGMSLSIEAAKSLSGGVQDPVSAAELAQECLKLTDDLADAGRYEEAVSMATVAKDAALIAKQKHFQSLAIHATRQMALLQKEAERLRPFQETLKTDIANPEANSEVGKFQCLVNHRWDIGLPQLARGSDKALRQLAEAELKGTEDPNAQAALGDLWNTYSSKLSAGMRSSARSRAREWYWRALTKMSGQERLKLERKAAKIVTEKAEIRVSARNLGAAELHITKDRMTWKTLSGETPSSVQVNSQYWPVSSTPELLNRGSTRYFLDDVNLETATLAQIKNSGAVKLLLVSPAELVIQLKDQTEADFELRFGQ